jgi:hypothetical protein
MSKESEGWEPEFYPGKGAFIISGALGLLLYFVVFVSKMDGWVKLGMTILAMGIVFIIAIGDYSISENAWRRRK